MSVLFGFSLKLLALGAGASRGGLEPSPRFRLASACWLAWRGVPHLHGLIPAYRGKLFPIQAECNAIDHAGVRP